MIIISKGIGGKAIKSFEDKDVIIYHYGAYNLNIQAYKKLTIDGMFTIQKAYIKYDFATQIEKNRIAIVPCRNCWRKFGDFDEIALKLIVKLLQNYEKTKETLDNLEVHC